jgi:DNA-binding NarL/FixJ family response regulator
MADSPVFGPGRRCRILVADDHALVRHGIRKVFALDPGLEVVGEAATAGEVLAWLAADEVDVLLLDLSMPGCTGLDLIARVVATYPRVPVLVLTMNADRYLARAALRAGVRGFLSKDSTPQQLIDAVHDVGHGRIYVDPSLELEPAGSGDRAAAHEGLAQLSARERQVLIGLVGGKPVSDIAAELKVAANTVSTYKARLMEKLGQGSLSELVRFALRHGLVD